MSDILNSLKSDWNLSKRGTMARVPLYHQLYSVLKNSILNGTIAHGARMPTEQQLAANFDVSRITAKRAMDELAAESLIARYRGKGSHVTYQYEPRPVQAPLVGMLENLIEMGRHSIVRVISIEQVAPPAEIRKLLELKAGESVHKVIRVRSSEEGEPYAYYVSWTKGIRKGFTRKGMESTPRLDLLKENGIELTRVEQTISAASATGEVARELGTEEGAALLSILRSSFDGGGHLVDVLDCLYNPKRYTYKMVMSLD